MPWTDTITPLDGNQARGVCWDPDNGVFVAAGQDLDLTEALLASANGIDWPYQASPLDGGIGYAVTRSTLNGVTVAVGTGPDGVSTAIVTSPDTAAWTDRGNPFVGFGAAYGVAIRDSDDAILLAGVDPFNAKQLAISTDDGATWALIEALGSAAVAFCVAVRASDDLLLVGGHSYSATNNYVAASPDGGATWTGSKPFGNAGFCWGCDVRVSDGALVVVGMDSSGVAAMAISTDDGATWTTHQPFGATTGSRAYGVGVRGDDTIFVVGYDATHAHQLSYSTDGGSTWTTRAPFGAGGQAFAILFGASLFVAGNDTFGNQQLALTSNDGVSWTTAQPLGPSGGEGKGIAKSSTLVSYIVSGTTGSGDQVAINSDPFLASWTRTSPFGAGRTAGGAAVRSSDGLVVVAGMATGSFGGDNQATQVAISNDDAATWTAYSPFNLPQGQGTAVACNQSSGVVLAGASSAGYALARSTDGLAYAAIDSPFNQGTVIGIDYSPDEGRWMAAGYVGGAAVVAYSDDDGLTWTVIATPMDGSFGIPPSVYRDEANGNWYLLGQTTGSHALAASNDGGATWTEVTTPLDPVAGVGQANAMVNAGGQLALGGTDSTSTKQMCSSVDDGATWALDPSTPAPFGDGGTAYALAYSDPLTLAVVAGYSVV